MKNKVFILLVIFLTAMSVESCVKSRCGQTRRGAKRSAKRVRNMAPSMRFG